MPSNRKSLIVPVLLIAIGTGWLLGTLGIGPQKMLWIWTLGLGAIGLLTFIVWGLDKITAVVGPFFLLASALSVLRQTNQLSVHVEIPILVIATGVLLLIAHLPSIPAPAWIPPTGLDNASAGKKPSR